MRRRNGNLVLNWRESAANSVTKPAQIGFGGKLVEGAVSQLRGTIEYDWRPEGLLVAIQWPEGAVGKFVEQK